MEFRARLNRISHIYRDWQGGGKPQGVLAGVVFRWAQGGEYLTGTLRPGDVEKLRHLPHVTIEATAMTMPKNAGVTPIRELIVDPVTDEPPAPITPPPALPVSLAPVVPPPKPPVSLEQTLRPVTRQPPHKNKQYRR